jgi:cobalt-zinc-cadmium efflux system outer membrane protein
MVGQQIRIFLFAFLFFLTASISAYAKEIPPPPPKLPDSANLRQVIRYGLDYSLQAQSIERRRAIAQAEILIEQQWNNPVLIGENSRSTPNYFVGAGYLFELGGKRSKRIEVAKNAAAVAEMTYRSDLLTLQHEVRLSFYQLLEARQKSSELKTLQDLSQKLDEISKERFDLGAVAKFDVLQADLEVKRNENELKQAIAEEKAAELKLNSLLSLPQTQRIDAQGSLEDRAQMSLQDLITQALDKHPELQAILYEVKAEEARLALAHAGRIPDLDVESGSEIHDPDFQYGWRASVRMSLPIFNKQQGEISRSNAALNSLRAEESFVRQKISADIQQAYLKYEAADKKAENFRTEILPLDLQIQELSMESYHEGKTGLLPAIDAQRNSRRVRIDYLTALMELQTALADLEQAAGVDIQ